MKVRATRLGYFNDRRRREGEIFEVIDKKAFSPKWMEIVDGPKPAAVPPPKEPAPAPAKTSSEEVI